MPSRNSNSRKKRRDHVKAQPTVPPVAFPASMSQAEMQHIIANAIIEAKKADEDAKQKQKESNIRELQEAIGFKKYNDKNRLLRIIKIAINEFKCIFKICVLPRKNIKGDRVTFGILSMLLTLIFALVSLVLYVVTFIFFVCAHPWTRCPAMGHRVVYFHPIQLCCIFICQHIPHLLNRN